MNLYEITNDWYGESYERVYAWAENEESAVVMARNSFEEGHRDNIEVRLLLNKDYAPFVTKPSSSGWER